MEISGGKCLDHEIPLTEVTVVTVQEERKAIVPTFTHEGATVYLKFSENGKTLDDLLVNYFKTIKQQ